jgi:gas vesicle protein
MQETQTASIGGSLTLFLAGAAIGGLLVALNTPKTGPELREDLRGFGRRAKRQAEGLAEDAGETWDRLQGKAEAMAQEAEKDQEPMTRH